MNSPIKLYKPRFKNLAAVQGWWHGQVAETNVTAWLSDTLSNSIQIRVKDGKYFGPWVNGILLFRLTSINFIVDVESPNADKQCGSCIMCRNTVQNGLGMKLLRLNR